MGKITVEDLGDYFSVEESAEAYKIAYRLSKVLGVEYVRVSKGSAPIDAHDSYTPCLDYKVNLDLGMMGSIPGLGKLIRIIRFGSSGQWAIFAEEEDPYFQPPPAELVFRQYEEINLLKNWWLQKELVGFALCSLLIHIRKRIETTETAVRGFVDFT